MALVVQFEEVDKHLHNLKKTTQSQLANMKGSPPIGGTWLITSSLF